ncbi:MAG: META domain-containing protein [Gammaproteobacteria bacterium]|nr:META domain-containing protein [Gammaproteobacteria bacterium]
MALLVSLAGCATAAQGERLRGGYTFGHEVRTFCPEINSQCYWLGPGTPAEVRQQLNDIYDAKKPGLYKPVCVVVDGVIDRDSPRSGFAADYDGLIDVTAVHGACEDSSMLVPGDLNHRRWVLSARNGVPVSDAEAAVVLDFGERLFVEGREGCRHFSGFATLAGDTIRFDGLDFDLSSCAAGGSTPAALADQPAWRIELARGELLLHNGATRLAFERDDWR